LTDEFSDEAVRYVERHKDHPFFLYLAYNAPHGPLQATDTYLSRFAGIQDPRRRTYAAMVSAVDDGVGRLLATLRDLDLEKETLLFYLSDNGGPETKNGSDNGPLRGGKSDPWEGGIRVPFAAQWPGRLPKGLVYRAPVISLDIFATIAALAGVPANPERPLDGVNLMPYLTGENPDAPHDVLYLRKFDQGVFAVRRGDHKLVIPKRDAAAELYNLEDDIGETENRAKEEPGRLAALEALRVEWNAQLVEPVFDGLMVRTRASSDGAPPLD
jgi:arylsulfatase A-like enzyme